MTVLGVYVTRKSIKWEQQFSNYNMKYVITPKIRGIRGKEILKEYNTKLRG